MNKFFTEKQIHGQFENFENMFSKVETEDECLKALSIAMDTIFDMCSCKAKQELTREQFLRLCTCMNLQNEKAMKRLRRI